MKKIKQKKRIYRPRLTMKHKEKQLKYARQYQTMSAKEWRKIVFPDEKKFNLDGPHGFPEENYSSRYSRGRSLTVWWSGPSHL